MGILLYAADIDLIADSREVLQKGLYIVASYGEKYLLPLISKTDEPLVL